MSTTIAFTAARAHTILQLACHAHDIPSDDPTLLRLGENAIFKLPHTPIIVRIASGHTALPDARKEVAVARWLHTAGLPAARALPTDQPILIDGHPVTFWNLIADSGQQASTKDLGRILRTLHGLAIPAELQLPRIDPLHRVDERIAAAPNTHAADQDFLRERSSSLREQFARLTFDRPDAALHGDAHVRNLIRQPSGGTALLDFQTFSRGPRELDLATTAVEFELGWHTASHYRRFCAAYGQDIRTWCGFKVLRAITLLKMATLLLQNSHHSPAIAAEASTRLATLKDPTSPRVWQPF